MHSNIYILQSLLILLTLGQWTSTIDYCVEGLAYAPNFITKIISSSTGKEPVGLLDVGKDTTDDDDAAAASADNDEDKEIAAAAAASVATGPIITRFPPEPNGYLHLGHAKAVSFNFAVARMFPPDGRCHMRLDDTNPSKEGQEYVDSILEDVRWIQSGCTPFPIGAEDNDDKKETQSDMGPWFGPVRTTSNCFDFIYECAVSLIKSGDAYVESLSADEMREYRGTLTKPGKESPFRNRSVEENLEMFEKMRAGEYKEGEHILRAKIDMSSPNINMRDPALYRIKHEAHQNTGDKWCVYPMYDFSHPISDALEGITHSLCTLEFEDHRPLYDWTIDKLSDAGLIKSRPRQIEFSRLNLKYTVLSKRKLIQLVENNFVNGWDDPRMPTLSGMRRRGVPPSALRLFCERVGISKADSNIDFGVLEDCVREVMDGTSSRAFAILNPLKVTITNWQGSTLEDFEVPRHPKIEEMGNRVVPFGKNIFIERSDFFDTEGPEGNANNNKPPRGFKRLLPGGKVRLKYAYVISCDEIIRDPDTNEPIELKCTLYPETRAGVTPEGEARVKGIIQWVEASAGVKCKVNQYDRLFKTEEPGKESGDFTKDINPDSLQVLENVVVEPAVAMDALGLMGAIRNENKKDEADKGGTEKLYHSNLSYQFERSGYFALDPSSDTKNLVFNRVVTLRDTWGGAPGGKAKGAAKQSQRNRGGEKQQQQKQQGQKKGGAGVVEDARRIALRAGTILEAGPHPEADSLIVCKVDCGDISEENEPAGPRTVVAGLAGKIPFEELVGRKIVCLTNLKPARMRGIESEAMLLAASDGKYGDDEKVELLDVADSVPNGELLSFEGKEPSEPDVMLKSKGAVKVWDRVKACLKSNEEGEATYINEDKVHRIMSSDGPVKTSSLKDCVIQ
uniref:glutamine--tRNA ligase n=1 Tax=Helicotheca tamesis TaxID=374047 RepID=A0A7S2I8Z6_9STRA|mmetsp:Transcript_6752/g.9113  ORF Transcript_6752/g.9113 Transcript_6752/m.9113 type:complete len:905 (+) Transcript_6752:208-2922(+)